jgi:hypothetical protein
VEAPVLPTAPMVDPISLFYEVTAEVMIGRHVALLVKNADGYTVESVFTGKNNPAICRGEYGRSCFCLQVNAAVQHALLG